MNHLPEAAGVYVLRSPATGRVYVGSTRNIRRRVKSHFLKLTARHHHNSRLQAAFDSGVDLEARVLRLIDSEPCRMALEGAYISAMDAADPARGYNIQKVPGRSNLGIKADPVWVEKNRKGHLGLKQTAETIEKRTGRQRGRKLPPEWCANISSGKMGGSRDDIRSWAPAKFARFTPDEAAAIRARYRAGGLTYRVLAEEFGCHTDAIRRAVLGLGVQYAEKNCG